MKTVDHDAYHEAVFLEFGLGCELADAALAAVPDSVTDQDARYNVARDNLRAGWRPPTGGAGPMEPDPIADYAARLDAIIDGEESDQKIGHRLQAEIAIQLLSFNIMVTQELSPLRDAFVANAQASREALEAGVLLLAAMAGHFGCPLPEGDVECELDD